MNKIKLHTGLASIMIVASIFAGWQTLLLVSLLLFLFCEFDEKVKDVAVKVITFYVGYSIVSLGWDIITHAVSLLAETITSFVTTFNTYVDPLQALDAAKIVNPIHLVIDTLDGVVSILFTLVKIGFVLSILTGKGGSNNILFKKIRVYVDKAIYYVNHISTDAPLHEEVAVEKAEPVSVKPESTMESVSVVEKAPVTPISMMEPVNNAETIPMMDPISAAVPTSIIEETTTSFEKEVPVTPYVQTVPPASASPSFENAPMQETTTASPMASTSETPVAFPYTTFQQQTSSNNDINFPQ